MRANGISSMNAWPRQPGRLQAAGAEGVILGCTEIPMLIRPQDVAIQKVLSEGTPKRGLFFRKEIGIFSFPNYYL